MSRTRWLIVLAGLAFYWPITGREIALARADQDPRYYTWWGPGLLTCPCSVLAEGVGQGAPPEVVRRANTAATIAGAILNGLAFAAVVRFWPQRHQPPTDEARDYTDGPDGVTPDGRADPPAG